MKIESEKLNSSSQATSSLLWMIIAVASILRLWELTGFSLSNDELSALARLQFDSVGDVIKGGVYPDFHPAGVQVFLFYWTKIFGFSEFMVRLPFALMGIASVYFLFRIGSYWFGTATGLLAAAALGVLEYPLLYSQIARPYSPGLFFSLLAAFFWTRALFEDQKSSENKSLRLINFIGFAFSVSACMYIHYFSFIFAGILCFAGLFFLKRSTSVPYLLSGVAIVLLYIPHIDIFIHHVSKGGVGGAEGWLGPPGEDAFGKYLDFCFNDSSQLKLLYFIITTGTILVFRKDIKLGRFHLLALVFFALPFAIAYYYSIWKNPVFQHSVLLFSFPYLLLLLFSFLPKEPGSFTIRFLLVGVLAGGFYSTVYEKKYYATAHFSEFRGVANRVKELDEKFGKENITRTISVFSPYYISYYLDKINHPSQFAITSVMTKEERMHFREVVESAKTPYFLYAFSNVYDDSQFDLIIRSKYPWVLLRDSMLNSGLRFYSRERSDTALNRLPAYTSQYGFETNQWNSESSFRDSLVKYEGFYSTHLTSESEYGPGLMNKVESFGIAPGSVIELSIAVLVQSINHGAKFVLSIDRGGKSIFWTATNFNEYPGTPGKWTRVFLLTTIPPEIQSGDELKIYCWNEKREEFWLDDFKMSVYSPR